MFANRSFEMHNIIKNFCDEYYFADANCHAQNVDKNVIVSPNG